MIRAPRTLTVRRVLSTSDREVLCLIRGYEGQTTVSAKDVGR